MRLLNIKDMERLSYLGNAELIFILINEVYMIKELRRVVIYFLVDLV